MGSLSNPFLFYNVIISGNTLIRHTPLESQMYLASPWNKFSETEICLAQARSSILLLQVNKTEDAGSLYVFSDSRGSV